MGLTKKDFKELATMCGHIQDEEEQTIVLGFLIRFCYTQNGKFDEDRFVEWVRRTAKGESTKGLG